MPRSSLLLSLLLLIPGVVPAEEYLTERYSLKEVLFLEDFAPWTQTWNFKSKEGEENDPFSGPPEKNAEGKTPFDVKHEHGLQLEDPAKLKNYVEFHTPIRFPEGTWIRYNAFQKVLTVHHAKAIQLEIKELLTSKGLLDHQVQITHRVISFTVAEIDKLDRKYPTGIPQHELVTLWTAGSGKTISSQSVVTIAGVNCIIECVDEILYPTEMDADPKKPSHPDAPVIYGGFETREIGSILNVTPTVSADHETIYLVLLPEVADLKQKAANQTTPLQNLTPTFSSLNLTTSIKLKNGSTHVVSRTNSRDPNQHLVQLISARLVYLGGAELEMSDPPQENP